MIWLIFILVMIASRIVQVTLQNRFEKYSQVPCKFSGAEVAQKMLDAHGIKDVKITCIKGTLTDHYNPVNKTVNLSESVYSSRSIAAAAIAAHECGHVVQHSEGYAPLKLRTALVPVVTLANNTVQWVLLIGILMLSISPTLLYVGIGLFAMTTLFSVITLPVEINASSRATEWLEYAGITDFETRPMAEDALKWAAYTYVIAAIGSIATLLYYISLANNRR